jgi:hypothetical protein
VSKNEAMPSTEIPSEKALQGRWPQLESRAQRFESNTFEYVLLPAISGLRLMIGDSIGLSREYRCTYGPAATPADASMLVLASSEASFTRVPVARLRVTSPRSLSRASA